MAETKLTPHPKVRDEIDTIARPRTKLRYGIKYMNQFCSLSLFLLRLGSFIKQF